MNAARQKLSATRAGESAMTQSIELIRATLEDMRRNGLTSGLPQEHAFTLLAEITRLRETVQRYEEHHEHCTIAPYHGVRDSKSSEQPLDEQDNALIEAGWNCYVTAICPRDKQTRCNHANAALCCGGGADGNCDCVICHPERW